MISAGDREPGQRPIAPVGDPLDSNKGEAFGTGQPLKEMRKD
jgi:hypothetical protein